MVARTEMAALAVLVGALLSASAADEERVPVGLVTGVKGPAVLERGGKKMSPSEFDGEPLLPGDKVTAGEKGEVKLMRLTDGRRLRLKPGQSVTAGAKGLEPADALEEAEGPTADRALLKSLREAYQFKAASGGAATKVLRGGPSPSESDRSLARGVSPLFGARVLTDHPSFAWPAAEGALGYRVQVLAGPDGAEKPLWTAVTAEPRLAYPEEEKVLPLGGKYRWRVTARLPGDKEKDVVDGKFFTASAREAERLARVKRLAEGADPGGWLVAADAYDASGVYGKALPLYEQLAKESPNAVNYLLALAAYYERAGRDADAKKALARAKELGAKVGE